MRGRQCRLPAHYPPTTRHSIPSPSWPRTFASSDELTAAILVLVADHLGLRTSFLTQNSRDGAEQHIRAAHNLPGGSDVAAGIVVLLEDTF